MLIAFRFWVFWGSWPLVIRAIGVSELAGYSQLQLLFRGTLQHHHNLLNVSAEWFNSAAAKCYHSIFLPSFAP